MIKLTIPFPPAILGPNRREHWAKKLPHKQAYVSNCRRAAKKSFPEIQFPEGNIPVSMVYFSSSNRKDLDNCLSATKSGLDAIANAWGINDKRFRPITIDFGPKDKDNARVELTFGEVK